MNGSWWHWLTPFGNSAILLPVAGLVAAWLLLRPATRRAGWWWCGALLVECGVVAGTKFIYMAWGWAPPQLNFVGLSGDSAMAFVFWPAASAYVVARRFRGWRVTLVVVGMALAAFVAASRVVLYSHSLSEAVGGGLFGAIIVTVFLAATWHEPPAAPPLVPRAVAWVPVALLVGVLLLTARQARPIDYQNIIANAARVVTGHVTVYKRCDLGPWAALRPQDRNCVPRGPETLSY